MGNGRGFGVVPKLGWMNEKPEAEADVVVPLRREEPKVPDSAAVMEMLNKGAAFIRGEIDRDGKVSLEGTTDDPVVPRRREPVRSSVGESVAQVKKAAKVDNSASSPLSQRKSQLSDPMPSDKQPLFYSNVPNKYSSQEATKSWFEEIARKKAYAESILSNPNASEQMKAWAKSDIANTNALWAKRPDERLQHMPRPAMHDSAGWAEFDARMSPTWDQRSPDEKFDLINTLRVGRGLAPLSTKSLIGEYSDRLHTTLESGYAGVGQAGWNMLRNDPGVNTWESLGVPMRKMIDMASENHRAESNRVYDDYKVSDRAKTDSSLLGERINANALAVQAAEATVKVPEKLINLAPGGGYVTGAVGAASDYEATFSKTREALLKAGYNNAQADALATELAKKQLAVNALVTAAGGIGGEAKTVKEMGQGLIQNHFEGAAEDTFKEAVLNPTKREYSTRYGVELDGLKKTDREAVIGATENLAQNAFGISRSKSPSTANATNGGNLKGNKVEWHKEAPYRSGRLTPEGYKLMSGPPLRKDNKLEMATENLEPYGLYPTKIPGVYLLADPHSKDAQLIFPKNNLLGQSEGRGMNE